MERWIHSETHQVDLSFRAEEHRDGRCGDGTDSQRKISVTHCTNVLLQCWVKTGPEHPQEQSPWKGIKAKIIKTFTLIKWFKNNYHFKKLVGNLSRIRNFRSWIHSPNMANRPILLLTFSFSCLGCILLRKSKRDVITPKRAPKMFMSTMLYSQGDSIRFW